MLLPESFDSSIGKNIALQPDGAGSSPKNDKFEYKVNKLLCSLAY